MTAHLKNLVKRVVTPSLQIRARRSAAQVGIAFCYHRIDDPPGTPENELVPALSSERFAEQIDLLRSRYDLVPASELWEAAIARRPGRRMPASITFDDDLPTHVRKAMPLLLQAGAPATFFLSGASMEAPFAFWWERLQRAWETGLVDAAQLSRWRLTDLGPDPTIRNVAAAVEALTPGERDRVAAELLLRLGPDPPESGMRSGDVETLVSAGFEVGFHTLRHDRLPGLGDDALARAMSDGREALQRVTRSPLRSVSYPHGEADPRVARAARAAGFEYGFAATGGPLEARTDPHLIDRRYPAPGSAADLDWDVARTIWAAVGRKSRSVPAAAA